MKQTSTTTAGMAVFAAALFGGLVGFLVYNHYPAKVFMGDTGSLFLGGAVAALAFAEGVSLIDVRRQFLPQRDLSGLIAADGIHLTMSGYRCLFDTLADWVRARL